MKNVLLLPGWMTSLKLYSGNASDFTICLGKLNEKALFAEHVVGFSLGALIALRDIKNIRGRIILINPLVPKRNITVWFIRWVNFVMHEGLFLEIQKFTVNPMRYVSEFVNCVKLLNIDFSRTLDNISQDKVTVIRGKNDKFFCDDLAVNFLRSKNIEVVEVNAGHNWSEEIEKTLNNLLRK